MVDFLSIKQRATELAGEPGDILPRVVQLHQIYIDSAGNHVFPLVALHGALWARNFFDVGGTLSKLISQRYFYDPRERAFRHGLLKEFADQFKRANRQVFIDTYTNYYFTRDCKDHEAANCPHISQELSPRLRQMHASARSGEALAPDAVRDLFESSLRWEQEQTVAPAVEDAVAGFTCPILRNLILRPAVRFKYFPRMTYLFFKNFADKDERIKYALHSYDLGVKAGWQSVVLSMGQYGSLPDGFVPGASQSLEAAVED